MTTTIKVGLIDDHRLFRSGMRSMLEHEMDCKVILEASNGKEMIEKINPNALPDIVFMDINMPIMDGIEATSWLRKHYPQLKVIVLSMAESADRVLPLVKLGIKGYLLKDVEPSEFSLAIKTVMSDELYYPKFVTDHIVHSFISEVNSLELSNREKEFLKLAGSELTYREIAEALNISVRSVDSLREMLFEKLHVKSRVGLVLYAIKNKLILS